MQVFAATEPRLCDAGPGWPEAHDSAPLRLRIMDLYRASNLVNRLIKDHPDKAADILARCCSADQKVASEIESFFLLPQNGQQEALRTPHSVAITFPPRTPARSSSSQHSGSPPPHRRVTSQDVGPFTLSPPPSSGSRSTRGAATSGETILLIDLTEEGGFAEKPVRMKTAPIEYSLIRGNIAHERITNTAINQGEYHVSVPHTANPDTRVSRHVSESITLTWRRPNHDSTHETTFYLVPKDTIKADILLGYGDSGEGIPGVYTRFCYDFIGSLD